MHLCLFEDDRVNHLRPLVETRAAYDLRLAMRTVLETARDAFDDGSLDGLILHARPLVADVTARAHPDADVLTAGDGAPALPSGADVLFLNGRFVARGGPALRRLVRAARKGDPARAFYVGDALAAAWVPDAARRLDAAALAGEALGPAAVDALPAESLDDAPLLERPPDLLDALRPALARDFAHETGPYNILDDIYSRRDADVHPSVVGVNPEAIYLAPGARVRPGAVLNAEDGPVYVGQNATVYERAVLRGPCYVGPESTVKVGADVEGTALGYYSKVGGEVHDVIVHALSNKGHSGFLGDAYLGQWCNLGAGTNNSNLKNDYGTVSTYDPAAGRFRSSGRRFAGLFMGDHSKCGIDTMFNTGTVVGTFCNVYDGGFPPRYLPPFSWGSPAGGFADYRLDKALSVADTVMARRDVSCTDADRALLAALFDRSADERAKWH
jgi:UDP-N-acetylglucosamine diphosphorylase/glucosamine-1-phosphate N-acetyltransferase